MISKPETYNKKKIRVIVSVRIEFEGNAIYLNPYDQKINNYKNGIWLNLKDDQYSKFKSYSGKSVLIEGVFSSKGKGHLGLWSGSIKNITRFEEYPKSK